MRALGPQGWLCPYNRMGTSLAGPSNKSEAILVTGRLLLPLYTARDCSGRLALLAEMCYGKGRYISLTPPS